MSWSKIKPSEIRVGDRIQIEGRRPFRVGSVSESKVADRPEFVILADGKEDANNAGWALWSLGDTSTVTVMREDSKVDIVAATSLPERWEVVGIDEIRVGDVIRIGDADEAFTVGLVEKPRARHGAYGTDTVIRLQSHAMMFGFVPDDEPAAKRWCAYDVDITPGLFPTYTLWRRVNRDSDKEPTCTAK